MRSKEERDNTKSTSHISFIMAYMNDVSLLFNTSYKSNAVAIVKCPWMNKAHVHALFAMMHAR